MAQMRQARKFGLENLKRKGHIKELSVDGKIILQRILKEYSVMCAEFSWVSIETTGRLL
jgi:hypothetical protein